MYKSSLQTWRHKGIDEMASGSGDVRIMCSTLSMEIKSFRADKKAGNTSIPPGSINVAAPLLIRTT